VGLSYALWGAGWEVAATSHPHLNGLGGRLSQLDPHRREYAVRNLALVREAQRLHGTAARQRAAALNAALPRLPASLQQTYQYRPERRQASCDDYDAPAYRVQLQAP